MHWYYQDEDKQIGPISDDDFQILVMGGAIQPETLIWHENLPGWMPYGSLKKSGLQPTMPPNIPQNMHMEPLPKETLNASDSHEPLDLSFDDAQGPFIKQEPQEQGYAPKHTARDMVRCNECGREFGADEIIKFGDTMVCAECKPLFVQRLREGVTLAGEMDYAGFWIRFGAKVIDAIIVGVAGGLLGFIIGLIGGPGPAFAGLNILLSIALNIAYVVYFLGTYSATPGKMALGLKVLRPDGEPLTYARACGRYFAEFLSAIIFSIGYLMAAFDSEKRALHDRICDTRVVKA